MAMRLKMRMKKTRKTIRVMPLFHVNCFGSAKLFRQGFEHCKREKKAMM